MNSSKKDATMAKNTYLLKRSYALTEKELETIKKAKRSALLQNIALNDSQVVRLALEVFSELSDQRFAKKIATFNKPMKKPT